MRFEDEPWVRLYVSDTTTRLTWSWQANAIFDALLRKWDRAGLIKVGNLPVERVVAMHTRIPLEVVEAHLHELMREEPHGPPTMSVINGYLVCHRHVTAQHANSSNAKRSREHRERRKAMEQVVQVGLTYTDEGVGIPEAQEAAGSAAGSEARATVTPVQSATQRHGGSDALLDGGPVDATQRCGAQRGVSEAQRQRLNRIEENRTEADRQTEAHRHGALPAGLAAAGMPSASSGGSAQGVAQEGAPGPARVAEDHGYGAQVDLDLKTLSVDAGASDVVSACEQVYDWLWEAKRRLQPGAKRTSHTEQSADMVLAPLRSGYKLDDWRLAIFGTLKDLAGKDKRLWRCLSLETLHKRSNFERAMRNAEALLTDAERDPGFAERAARERAEREAQEHQRQLELLERERAADDEAAARVAEVEARLRERIKRGDAATSPRSTALTTTGASSDVAQALAPATEHS
jgi:hypothetical protein